MKVLVCIDNNLKIDTRLKRHVSTIAAKTDSVHVLVRANPKEGFGLELPNVTHSFFDEQNFKYRLTVMPSKIRKTAKALGIYNEILKVCPFLISNEFYQENVMSAYSEFLGKNLRGGRWKEITGREAEEMSMQQAMSYVVSFLINSIYMAKEASKFAADVILCNDVDTLLCGVVHKKKYHSRVVYDVHDIMCDISPKVFPLLYSEMLMKFESIFIHAADRVMGVGDYLLQWEQMHYGISAPCIPIYSCNKKEYLEGIFPKKYAGNKPIRIYFHGYAFEARKLDVMVKAVRNIEGIKLVFRSDSNDYLDGIKILVKEYAVEEKVEFLGMVPTEEVLHRTNLDGDVGIYASVPDGCVNWSASFTNKFMEYLGAGLPIITTKAPDQMRIVKEYDCGFILEDDSVSAMEKVFREVVDKKDELEIMSKNSWRVAREIFDWAIYEKRLIDVVLNKENIFEYALPLLKNEQREALHVWETEDRNNLYKYNCKKQSILERKYWQYIYRNSFSDFVLDVIYELSIMTGAWIILKILQFDMQLYSLALIYIILKSMAAWGGRLALIGIKKVKKIVKRRK